MTKTTTLLAKSLFALCIALLSFGHIAQAQLSTIYSDFPAPPAPLYDASNGWLVSGSASPYGAYSEAMAFTPSVTRKLDYVDVAVGFYSGLPKTFQVEVRKDCGGIPCGGRPLYAWGPMVSTYSYGTCCAIERTPVDADIPVFAGRQYWIVVKAKPGSTSVFVWNLNDIGAAGNVALSVDGGTTWTLYSGTQLAAFDVLGH